MGEKKYCLVTGIFLTKQSMKAKSIITNNA